MAELVINNTEATAVLVIPGDTIIGWLCTFYTTSSEDEDADFSRAFRSICCTISREKNAVITAV